MADRLRIIDGVQGLLTDDMALMERPEDVKHCQLLVNTAAGFAFFTVVDPREDIVDVWKNAQDEIAAYLRRLSLAQDRPGAYLALLVEGERPEDSINMQKIGANPFVCRKVVLSGITEGNLREKVSQLPFFPLPDELQRNLGALPPDPAVVLADTHLAVGFMDRLLGRFGIEPIKDDLLQARLDSDQTAFVPMQNSTPSAEVHGDTGRTLKARKIRLRNFRNFGPEFEPIELAGDLVVIFGRNGTGKSSVCEALEWALTGQSQRVSGILTDEGIDDDRTRSPLVNLRSGNDTATVDVWLEGSEPLHITRSITTEGTVTVSMNGNRSDDREILSKFSLVGEDTSIRVDQNVRSATQGCHFLSQDTILDFLRNDPEKRYKTYSFMAGTHQLAYAVRKTQRLLKLFHDDLRQRSEALASIESQVNDAEKERGKWAEDLQNDCAEVYDAPTLVRQGLNLVQKGLAAGVSMELPPMVGVAWAQLACETFLSLAPSRLIALHNKFRNVDRLRKAAADIPTVRDELNRHRTEYAQLQVTHAELRDMTDAVKQEQTSTRQSLATQQSDLVNAEAQREQILQLLIILERRERLRAEMQRAETAHSVREDMVTTCLSALTDLTSRRSTHAASVRTLTRQAQELSDTVAALQQVLEASSRRQVKQTQLDNCRQEVASLSAQESKKADEIAALRRQLQDAAAAAASQRAARDEFQHFVERRQQLLAELRGHIGNDETDCPVCGAGYGKNARLILRITEVLELLPEGLTVATDSLTHAETALSQVNDSLSIAQDELARLVQRRGWLDSEITTIQHELATERVTFVNKFPEYADAWPYSDRLHDAIKQLEQSHEKLKEEIASVDVALVQLNAQVPQAEAAWKEAANSLESILKHIEQIRSQLLQDESMEQALALPFDSEEDASDALQAHQVTISQNKDLLRKLQASLMEADHRLQHALDSRTSVAKEISATDERVNALAQQVHSFEADLRAEGIITTDPKRQSEQVKALMADCQIKVDELNRLVQSGERFLARINAYRIQTEVSRLDSQLDSLRRHQTKAQQQHDDVQQYYDKVGIVLANLQRLKAAQDAERLNGLEPLAVHLYHRFNAHPYFGGLDLEVNSQKQELYVRFEAEPGTGLTAEVNRYFSAAQANGVALSIFMGTALLQSWTSLGIICMDDPVQHLDDINIYALLDLVHTLVNHGRQVILTTASEDLYKMMLWRFAALNSEKTPRRFQALRAVGVTETGPEIKEDTPRGPRTSAQAQAN